MLSASRRLIFNAELKVSLLSLTVAAKNELLAENYKERIGEFIKKVKLLFS